MKQSTEVPRPALGKRVKKAGLALVLAAAATAGGIAVATPASAATLGVVVVTRPGYIPNPYREPGVWEEAWGACRNVWPQTRSAAWTRTLSYQGKSEMYFDCRDTP
ncbi:hypothetical protein AB0D91_45305 [Streptomyces canus]|uniref:hypothetical protein n=1 Tax=Streptomyces canus TaxID=58343 RepID=UPI0033D6E3E6